MNNVFVYGTLLSGQGNNRLLGDSPCAGKGYINGYRMYSLGGFPAIVAAHTAERVEGEVYVVDDETLDRLDMLEGYSRGNTDNQYRNMYEVEKVIVSTENGTVSCEVYTMSHQDPFDDDTWIESGSWIAHKGMNPYG